MGLDEAIEHDARYDRADEFMEVVHGHWDTWADDALIVDKATGRFADPDKVRRLDHKGEHFRSRGPFTVPRSAQGHPVVIQAGQSGRGRRFAARWGELIFTSNPNLEPARKGYAELKADAARPRPRPRAHEDRHALPSRRRADQGGGRGQVRAHRDAAARGRLADAAVGEHQLRFRLEAARRAVHRRRARPLQRHAVATATASSPRSATSKPTPRDFITITRRGKLPPPWVGGPKEVADMFEEWFTAPACDGFVVGAACVPGSYEDFIALVVPELQRRGLFQKDYKGATLRENLGLPRPVVARA